MRDVIVFTHVLLGAIALASALIAIGTRLLIRRPRIHALAGQCFTLTMVGIFVSALLIVSVSFNLFLTLVAVFSLYLALSGFLIARNRAPQATAAQQQLTWTALGVAAVMLAVGVYRIATGGELAIVLLSFGLIMAALALQERYYWARSNLSGPARIAAHLSRMLGGTIAIVTASSVVNLKLGPAWLAWLLPSLLIVPLIIGWNFHLRRPGADQSTPKARKVSAST